MNKRTFKHWTPRYIYNRLHQFYIEKTKPGAPWLTSVSISIIDELINPNDKMIEFGSGRSTPWFAKRVKELISVETNPFWYKKVRLDVAEFQNTNLIYVENANETQFRNLIMTIDDKSIDIALIDGAHRELCGNLMIDKMRLGGFMVIDNANLYLYNHKTYCPNSLKAHNEMTKEWKLFYERTLSFRRIWTTNGITDTLIIFF
jgi:predicted O-methyltransferase YrrM